MKAYYFLKVYSAILTFETVAERNKRKINKYIGTNFEAVKISKS